MVRTYFMALVALLVMVSANFAQAFGLGEITLKSYLNQPFDAEIEILDRRDLAKNEIIPKLASPEDFSRVGLQRNFFLTRLKFEVVFGEQRDYVKITSREPVNEPYLDFLIEFLWPEGRLLREYTVLLDPPSYAASLPKQMVPVVQKSLQPSKQVQPQSADDKGQAVSSEKSSTDVDQNDIAVSQPQTNTQESAQTNDRQTASQTRRTISNKDNETFWSIASRERPVESVSVQQTMLAIQKLNPDAFEHNNINYLKKNQILRMPTEEEIRALATRDAMGIVADQNRDWAGKTLAKGGSLPVDTAKLVGSRQVTPMQDDKQSGAQMKLVADSGSEGSAVGTYSGQGDAGIGSDESTRVLRENSMLQEDNQSLKSQIETSERLLSLKDQQIAELQARLAEQGVDASTSVDDEISNNVIERVAVDQQSRDQGFGEQESETAGGEQFQADEQDMVSEEEIQAALAEAKADAQLSDAEDLSFEADQEASEQLSGSESGLATSSQTASQTTQEASGSLLDNPIVLAAIALVVLLSLGGLGFFLYKKRTTSSETAYGVGDTGFDSEINDLDDGFDDLGGFSDDELDHLGGDDDVSGEDALTEANVYIAHERWDKAIQSLQSAIDSGDESAEVKMKLLEAYAGASDKQNFKALRADMLTEDPTLEADIDALATSMDGSSSASSQEFDMDATTRMDASDFDLDTGEDEFDISLDDLASDLDASFSADKSDENESTQIIENKDSDLSELEDSLDLSDSFSSSGDSDESDESDDSLDLDFDLDDDEQTSESASGSDKANDTVNIADTEIETSDEFDLEDTVVLDGSNQNEDDDGLELDLDELNFDDDDSATVDNKSSVDAEDDSDLELDFSDDDSLDLELDEPAETENDKSEEAPTLEKSGSDQDDDLDLSFDDFDMDDSSSDGEETLSLDSDDDDEFTLDLDDEDEQDFDFGEDDDLDGALDLSDESEAHEKPQEKPQEKPVEKPDDAEKNSDTEDSLFDGASDDEFDLPDEGDEAATKLDLARAYIDMGDEDGAKDILEEVLAEGDDQQKSEAKSLMEKL